MKGSIDELRSVCEIGFGNIALELAGIDDSLKELIHIAKTPDQTWAFEQYTIAQEAFRRNLFEESLDYINRAINGYGDRSGYRIEHRFFILRGMLRLGNTRNFDETIVNIGEALKDFLSAAKYAEHDHKNHCARSYGMAGWASYCLGNFVDAEKYLRQSLNKNDADAQSNFDLSKVLLRLGHEQEAMRYFRRAIEADLMYGIRAGSDPDFLAHKPIVEKVIADYRQMLLIDVKKVLKDYERIDIPAKEAILLTWNHDTKEVQNNFAQARREHESAPISEIIRYRAELPPMRDKAVQMIKSTIDALIRKSEGLRAYRGRDSHGNDTLSLTLSFLVAAAVYFFALDYYWVEKDLYKFNTLRAIVFLFPALFVAVVAYKFVAFSRKSLVNMGEMIDFRNQAKDYDVHVKILLQDKL
jgi:tetratricopeptide (TPR) repeat protein